MGFGRFSESRTPTPKPSIEAVFEHYYTEVQISDYGDWKKICCPLHVESRPSASINLELNRWKCHVCDVSEDSLDIVMREESLGFREAQEFASAWIDEGSEVLPGAIPGKPSRDVPQRPRFGGGGNSVPPRVRRRFGDGT